MQNNGSSENMQALDMNKPYVQVVKQQVKMHQYDLHEILVKLHIKFI